MIDLTEISARISTKDVYLCNEQCQGTKTRLVINDSILLSSFCIYANDYFSREVSKTYLYASPPDRNSYSPGPSCSKGG